MILKADWLQAEPVRTVMSALNAARPDSARFVGGCVRNTLMGHPVDDIDIATQLLPADCQTALRQADIQTVPTGFDHGTLTAIVSGQAFEITSLRRDVETDGRRAVVAFTEDWDEDARRRDFYLNAIYADSAGQVFDPTGRGIEDARSGQIIFIGQADQRLQEDYLRILRFFRFNAWYGAQPDAEGLAACTRQMKGLEHIAAERIWKELRRLLGAPAPFTALEAMRETGVLGQILPHMTTPDIIHDLHVAEHLLKTGPDPVLRLMALIPRKAEAVYATAGALRLSKTEKARLVMWAADNLPELNGINGRDLRALLYWHGRQAVADRAMLSGRDVRDIMAAISSWRRPDLPVSGKDALAAGFVGADIGEALSRLVRAWVGSDFSLSRSELLELWVEQKD